MLVKKGQVYITRSLLHMIELYILSGYIASEGPGVAPDLVCFMEKVNAVSQLPCHDIQTTFC